MTGPRHNPRTIRAYIRENPDLPIRLIAAHFDMDRSSISRHIRQMPDKPPALGKQRRFTCREPLRTVFLSIARNGIGDKALAFEIGVSIQLISAWRAGQREPTFFHVECLCALAGMTIIMEPKL